MYGSLSRPQSSSCLQLIQVDSTLSSRLCALTSAFSPGERQTPGGRRVALHGQHAKWRYTLRLCSAGFRDPGVHLAWPDRALGEQPVTPVHLPFPWPNAHPVRPGCARAVACRLTSDLCAVVRGPCTVRHPQERHDRSGNTCQRPFPFPSTVSPPERCAQSWPKSEGFPCMICTACAIRRSRSCRRMGVWPL